MNSNAELDVIAELDLAPIKLKLMHKESGEGWSRSKVDAVELEYRRFLRLLKLFPEEQVSPRFDVDIFWHYHILDTAKYAIDCEQIFGYFLHHYPYSGLGDEDDEANHHRSAARMCELYEATFGEAYTEQAAYCSPINAVTASSYCSPINAVTASSYCSPMKAATASSYCSPMKATTAVSYCSPMKAATALSQPVPEKTAYCSPMKTVSAFAYCSPMKATTARPRAVAQNDSVYSPLAMAA